MHIVDCQSRSPYAISDPRYAVRAMHFPVLMTFLPNLGDIPKLLPTTVTVASVNTDRAAAVRACPPDFLVCHELSNSKPADVLQIFEHAHVVSSLVSLVQLLHAGAGKFLTLKAKSRFHVLEVFTIFDPALNAIAGFIHVDSSAAGTLIFFSQISQANAAVHSAGSDERCFGQGFHSCSSFKLTSL